jgi:hypothetical protein
MHVLTRENEVFVIGGVSLEVQNGAEKAAISRRGLCSGRLVKACGGEQARMAACRRRAAASCEGSWRLATCRIVAAAPGNSRGGQLRASQP